MDGCGELRENGCKFGHGVFQAVAGDEDFFVATGVGAFFRRQNLFEEFLTGAQAGKLNVDIPVGLQTVEADQLLGDAHDLHGLAHIQH